MAGEDEAVDVQVSEQSIDPSQGGTLVIDDVVHVTVPAGSLNDDADCTVYHGILYDELGNNSEGTPNSELLAGGQVNPLDLFEISMDTSGLTGSIDLSITYNQEILDAFTRSLGECVSGFSGFSANDLSVYYFDKTRGEWVPVYAVPDTTAHTFTVRTQYAGIYCYALKPASLETLGKYIIAHPDAYEVPESSEARFSGPSLSISPTGYPKPLPDPNGDNQSPVSDYTSSCSSKPGAFADNIMIGAFQSSCYMHDWCYRYGNWTYGHSKSYCDSEFLKGLMKGCATKGNLPQKFLCKKIRMGFFKVKVCIPNPMYLVALAYRAAMFIPCEAISVSMHAAVAYSEQGKKAYTSEKSGCYDYKNKGVKCEIARIANIKFDQRTISPGKTLGIEPIIYKRIPNNLTDEELSSLLPNLAISEREMLAEESIAAIPDSISWSVSPDCGILNPIQSNDNTGTQWQIPANAQPGVYSITGRLYYLGRMISEYVSYIKVIFTNINNTVALQNGNSFSDYALDIIHSSDGAFYSVISSGEEKEIRIGPCIQYPTLERNCHASGFIRSSKISKWNSKGELLWEKQLYISQIGNTGIPLMRIIDISEDPSGRIHLIADEGKVIPDFTTGTAIQSSAGNIKHMVIDSDSKLILNNTVSNDPIKSVAIQACDDGGDLIISENSQLKTVSITRYDASGNIIAGPTTALEHASFGSVCKNSNGIIITGIEDGESSIVVGRIDMQCIRQWSSAFSTGASVAIGGIAILPDGGALITAMGPENFVNGNGNTGSCCFVMKLDRFGNKVWTSLLPNVIKVTLPDASTTNTYYLNFKPVIAHIKMISDGTIYVTIHTIIDNKQSIVVYKLSTTTGEIIQGRQLYSPYSNATALSMDIDDEDRLYLSGIADGILFNGATFMGSVDWFLLTSKDY